MKILFKAYVLFLFFASFCKGQENYIVYEKVIDISDGMERINEKSILSFDKESSVYFEYSGDLSNVNTFLNNNDKIWSSLVIDNKYSKGYFQIKNNSFTKDNIFAIDNYVDFNWQISKNITKEILGYKCSKAFGNFRGRKYIAWFTNDLPLDIGPWKFRGLPGIILSISDSDNYFTFQASKISLNFSSYTNDRIYSRFNFIIPKDEKQFLSYKEYIEVENNHVKEIKAKVAANRPKGLTLISSSGDRDFDLEKSFEWENDAKKP